MFGSSPESGILGTHSQWNVQGSAALYNVVHLRPYQPATIGAGGVPTHVRPGGRLGAVLVESHFNCCSRSRSVICVCMGGRNWTVARV